VIRVEHARVGPVEYEPDEIVHFVGLPGFPQARRFVVRGHAQGSSLAWLVCLDETRLALVVANPWHFFPDYAPAIPRATLAALEAPDLDPVDILAVATVAPEAMTLNLAAPILIHRARRRGAQVILEDASLQLAARVRPPAAPAAP